jgi:hypothetical protein
VERSKEKYEAGEHQAERRIYEATLRSQDLERKLRDQETDLRQAVRERKEAIEALDHLKTQNSEIDNDMRHWRSKYTDASLLEEKIYSYADETKGVLKTGKRSL